MFAEITQSTGCEQAIRAPRAALRAKEVRKTSLTPIKSRHTRCCWVEEWGEGEERGRQDAILNPECNFSMVLRVLYFKI